MYTLTMALKAVPDISISAIVLNEGKLAVELHKAGIETTVIDESQYGFFSILRQIKDNMKGKDIDILHSHRYKENILGSLLKRDGLVKYLVQTVHGLGEPFTGIKILKTKIISWLNIYFTNKYYDKVITVSNDIQGQLQNKINPEKMITIHNSIDAAKTKPIKPPSDIKKEFGIDENMPVIGSVGRMVPVKGFDLFLKAAKKISESKPDIRFLLVGDGPMKTELEVQAKELGLGSKVIFPGFRNDVIDIINCFDIFIISSYHEGIPMVVLEAMALGKAIVSTSVGGMVEILINGESGLLIDSGNFSALAEGCLKVFESSSLKSKLQRKACERIEEKFDINAHIIRINKLYYGLVNQA